MKLEGKQEEEEKDQLLLGLANAWPLFFEKY